MSGRTELWSIALTLVLLVVAASIMQGFISSVSESLMYRRIERSVNLEPQPPKIHVLMAEKLIALEALRDVNELMGTSIKNNSLKIELSNMVSLAQSYLSKKDYGDALSSSLKALAEAWAWLSARMLKVNGSKALANYYTVKYGELVRELKELNASVFKETMRKHSLGYIVGDLAYAQFFTDYSWRVLELGNYSLRILRSGNASTVDAMIVARAYILSKELLRLARLCASEPDRGAGPKVSAADALKQLLRRVSEGIKRAYNDVQPFSIGARLVDYASSLAQSATAAASHKRYAVASYYALMAYAYALAADRLANSLYESKYFNTTISADAVLAKRADLLNAYMSAYRVNSSAVGMILLNCWNDLTAGDKSMVNCVNAYCLHFSKLPLTSSGIVAAYIYYARAAALAKSATNVSLLNGSG